MSSNNFQTPIATIAANLRLRRAGREFSGDCPACKYKDSFSIREGDNGSAIGCCHACHDQDAIFAALLAAGAGEATGWQREAPTRDDAARRAENAAKQAHALALWNASQPAGPSLTDTWPGVVCPAWRYPLRSASAIAGIKRPGARCPPWWRLFPARKVHR